MTPRITMSRMSMILKNIHTRSFLSLPRQTRVTLMQHHNPQGGSLSLIFMILNYRRGISSSKKKEIILSETNKGHLPEGADTILK
jgi:hypothetical protein